MDSSKTVITDASIQIPGYRLIEEIGQGGMATVYLAVQENFDRKVALKVMSQALVADQTFGERFQREAKIVAKLSHPHIVTVYDVGVVKNHHYIAMEFHPGGDLSKKLAGGISKNEAVLIVKQIALALDFAHSKGYIHRDIKPDNILFKEDGTAVLTDFGVARPTKSSKQMTQAGNIVGTPKYMSPEQAKGLELDARADLYALGVMFFEMLCGKLPFDGDDPIAVGIQHVKDPVPPLPKSAAEFSAMIHKLMAKDPNDRFQRGQAVVASLEKIEISTTGVIQRAQIDTLASTPPPTTPAKTNAIREQADSMRAEMHAEREERVSRDNVRRQAQQAKTVGIAAALAIVIILGSGLVIVAPKVLPKAKPLIELHAAIFGNRFGLDLKTLTLQSNNKSIKAPVSPAAGQEPTSVSLRDTSASATVKVSSKTKTAEVLQPNEGPTSTYGDLPAKDKLIVASHIASVVKQQEQSPAPEPDQTAILVERLLSEGDKALAQNNLSMPSSENALEKYRAVLAISAKQPKAIIGLHNVAKAYIGLSQKALEQNKTDKAKIFLQKALEIEPNIAQATSLAAAIKAAKVRIEKERQAAQKLAQEKKAKQHKAEKIRNDEKQAELLLNKVRITGLLRSAQNALTRGHLTSPPGENAFEKYQQVLAIDPNNEQTKQSILSLSDTIIKKTKESLAIGDYESAKSFLVQAIKVNPNHVELTELRQAIDEYGM